MLIDFHCHVFPKSIRENRSRFFGEEPSFELLYAPAQSKLIGTRHLIREMDEKKIDTAVIFGFPFKNEMTFKMNNDYIIESVQRFPDRLVGFCCFDLSSPKAPVEAERCLDAGLKGVGELAIYQSGINEKSLDQLSPIMSMLKERDLPLLMHTNEPIGHSYPGKAPMTLSDIYGLIKRFKTNTIVLAHFGGGILFYHLLKKEMKEVLANVYFDTAAAPYLYDPIIYRHAVDIIGAEKILLGSDFPLLPTDRYLAHFTKAGLTKEERDKISGQNAMALLKLR